LTTIPPAADRPERVRRATLPNTRSTEPTWWIDWATLLQRVYDVDALRCPCGGRLHFIDLVEDTNTARAVLRRLELDASAPAPGPRTGPTNAELTDLPPPDW